MTALLFTVLMLSAATPQALAQNARLRGIPDDPRTNLPSPSRQLQDLKSRQLDTLSDRLRQNEADRRQDLQRQNLRSTGCAADPSMPGCSQTQEQQRN